MNPLIERAQQTLRGIKSRLQEIDAAGIWKVRDNDKSLAEEADRYMMSTICRLVIADGKLHNQELELVIDFFGDNSQKELKEILKNYSRFHEEYSETNALPNFIEAAVYFDLVKNTKHSEAIIDLIEKFCNIVIAVDGNRTSEEVEILSKEVSRLIEFSIKSREIKRKELEKKGHKSSNGNNEKSEPSLNELLAELRSMIGLHRAKEEVTAATNLVRVRQMREEAGLPAMPVTLHMVFTGNPGTGKTTVARLIAQIYRELGLLEQGHLTEVDRSGLVGGYVGQTALKVQEVVQEARGGVLFIDEAYALKPDQQDSYGQEAINTLLKSMEDHRDDLVVIVAGYTDQMDAFLETNPGLRSRFNRYVHFDDYTGDELLNIFTYMSEKNGYASTQMATYQLKSHFEQMYAGRGKNFGNARDVRNVFETILKHQAARLMTIEKPTPDDLSFIDLADIAWLFERAGAGATQKGRA